MSQQFKVQFYQFKRGDGFSPMQQMRTASIFCRNVTNWLNVGLVRDCDGVHDHLFGCESEMNGTLLVQKCVRRVFDVLPRWYPMKSWCEVQVDPLQESPSTASMQPGETHFERCVDFRQTWYDFELAQCSYLPRVLGSRKDVRRLPLSIRSVAPWNVWSVSLLPVIGCSSGLVM